MATQVTLARAGAGKTESAQARLLALKRAKPLAKVWVLLSTERQISDFRRRLMGESVLFNIEFFTFYPLYNRLLRLGGTPQRCLDEPARYGLLREILRRTPLDFYRPIADKPGFIRVIAALIYELKQNLITPQELELAAGNPEERELARLYDAYQDLLRKHHLVDREGEGWLALDVLSNDARVAADVDLLIVDGYDQFNLLQARLLAQLGKRTAETLITLTTVEGREGTMGLRFTRALDRLKETHDPARLMVTRLPSITPTPTHQTPFAHLADQLLLPNAQSYPDPTPALRLLEAPDPTAEAALIMRRVKRLILDGTPPDAMLIAVRDGATYAEAFSTAARAYGVPIALNYGERLAANPAINALLLLLDLPKGGYRRRDLMDVLRSPYFRIPGVNADAVDALERAAYARRVTVADRAEWLRLIESLSAADALTDEEDRGADAEPALMDAESAAAFKAALKRFFEAITPPEAGDVRAYVAWLEGVIGDDQPDPDEDSADAPAPPAYTLDMPAAVRQLPDERFSALMERDLAALSELNKLLRALLSASSLFKALRLERVYTGAEFLTDLRQWVEHAAFQRGRSRDGRVLITAVSDARGLPHEVVFIPGMAEGLFPAPTAEDSLLLDSERRRLAEAGVELPTQAERADDEGLFYELIGLARRTLILSRPCYKNGETWAESHLYRAVRALFPAVEVERLGIGEPIPAHDVATHGEAAINADPGLRGWLARAQPDFWARVERGLRVERGRLARDPHDHYSGRLRDEMLIRRAAERLSPAHVWSASQLADFGVCAFRFFASRLLKLQPFETPEEGMDSRQLGTLQHAILEQTYRQFAERGVIIDADNADDALRTLHTVAADVFRDAPRRFGFRPTALWDDEQTLITRRLEQLIKLDFSGDSPISKLAAGERRAFQQETAFDDARLDVGGEHIRLRGVIDRMDRVGDGVVLIDYKSGSSRIPTSHIERGRNFQMMVYLTAAAGMVEGVGRGIFWHVRDRTTSGELAPDDPVIEAGKAHIRRMLREGRAGHFDARANGMDGGKCAAHCDFSQFCRVSVTNQDKADAAD